MASIPFEIYDNRGHKVSGLVYLEEAFVVFEVQVKKWGLYNEPSEKVKAELGVITAIRFEPGIFGDRIYVVPKRMELLEAIPGDHKGELKLKIAKRHRDEAQRFVAEVLLKKRSAQG